MPSRTSPYFDSFRLTINSQHFKMDRLNNRRPRRPSSDRFLSLTTPASSSASPTADDFFEDDIRFSTPSFSPIPSPATAIATTTVPKLKPQLTLLSQKSFSLETSGILAALPNPPSTPPSLSRTISISTPVATSYNHQKQAVSFPSKYHQSAPMHVPIMTNFRSGHRQQQRRHGSAFGFEDIDDVDVDNDVDGDMLRPHEIVARRLEETPVLSTSVLEGAGRTLKGRDLRQVRNAVFRHTGFID